MDCHFNVKLIICIKNQWNQRWIEALETVEVWRSVTFHNEAVDEAKELAIEQWRTNNLEINDDDIRYILPVDYSWSPIK